MPDRGTSWPVLGVLWLLVQHEPVVLLTQNVFLIIAIVGLILYLSISPFFPED